MRLLIIDPQKKLSFSVLQGLSQEGFITDRAILLKKGVWLARSNPYDVVILCCSSLEIITSLINQLNQECPDTYLLVLSEALPLEKRILLLEKGLDEAVIFPCSFRELVAKIRNLLRREKRGKENPGWFRVDDLVINPYNFTVYRGEKLIALRRKEFDLLLYLVRNVNRAITKTNILESVWDTNADLFTNTLEVHILNLRKKIDGSYPPERKLIHTIYGRGYLFGLRPALLYVGSTRDRARVGYLD